MTIANLQKCHIAEFHTDNWIAKAKNDGPLTYYKGDLKNYKEVLEYMLSTQCLVDVDKPIPERNPRFGCWKGDVTTWETFDEGCQAKALGVLLCLYKNEPALRGVTVSVNGRVRGLGGAILDAINALEFSQYTQPGGLPFPGKLTFSGIPGFWPQAPGWKKRECIFPEIAHLRTLNDGVHDQNLEAIVMYREVFGDPQGLHLKRILLGAFGMAFLQMANDGYIPEQFHPHGEPAWGRGHEPPSYTPRAMGYALLTYIIAHAVTQDKQPLLLGNMQRGIIAPLAQTPDMQFEHFLELKTLRPIWGKRDHPFEITYNRSEAEWPSKPHGVLDVVTKGMIAKYDYYVSLLGT